MTNFYTRPTSGLRFLLDLLASVTICLQVFAFKACYMRPQELSFAVIFNVILQPRRRSLFFNV